MAVPAQNPGMFLPSSKRTLTIPQDDIIVLHVLGNGYCKGELMNKQV